MTDTIQERLRCEYVATRLSSAREAAAEIDRLQKDVCDLVAADNERIKRLERERDEAETALSKNIMAIKALERELAEKDKRIEELERECERLRETIFWACGVNGTFRLRADGEGLYWWRRELRERAGISAEEMNRRALEGGEG